MVGTPCTVYFWGCDPTRFAKASQQIFYATRSTKVGSSLAAASDVAVRCLVNNVSETELNVSAGKAGEWEWAASRRAISTEETRCVRAAVFWLAVKTRFGSGVMPRAVTNDESSDRPVGFAPRSSKGDGLGFGSHQTLAAVVAC